MSDTTSSDFPEIKSFTEEELLEAGKARGRGRTRVKNCPDCKKAGLERPKAPGLGYCREHMRLRQRQYRKASLEDISVEDAREKTFAEDMARLREEIAGLKSDLRVAHQVIEDQNVQMAKSQMAALEGGSVVMDDDIKAQIDKAESQKKGAVKATKRAVQLLIDNGIDVPFDLKWYIDNG